MLSSQFIPLTEDVRVFVSSKHVKRKPLASIWLKQISDSQWINASTNDWELVNNAIVFDEEVDSTVYSQVEIRVGDTESDLNEQPSDISIVAGLESEIQALSTVVDDLGDIADNLDSIQTAAGAADTASAAALAAEGYKDQAQASATSASNYATNAEGYSNTAMSNANNASVSEANASTSETNASESESNALIYRNDAEGFKDDAETAKNLADRYANESEDVEVEAGKFSAYHWSEKAKDFAGGGTAADIVSITDSGEYFTSDNVEGALQELGQITLTQTDTPTLSGNTSGAEGGQQVITITNYSATATYTVNVDSGSYVRTDDTITWTLPAFTGVDDIHDLTVSALEPTDSRESETATLTMTVLDIESDQTILYESGTMVEGNFTDNGIDTTGTHDIFGDGSAIATYQFNNNGNDLGGNYDGTLGGSLTFADAYYENGGSFGGSTSHWLSSSAQLNIDNPVTVSMWIKPNSLAVNGYRAIFSSNNGSSSSGGFALFSSCNGSEKIRIQASTSGGWVSADGSNTIPSDTWSLITVVVYGDGVTSSELYVNGVKDSGLSHIFTRVTNANGIIFGQDNTLSYGNSYDGLIDQARMFNRALTPSEVEALYNEQIQTIDYSSNSLLALTDNAVATTTVVSQDVGDGDFANAVPTVDSKANVYTIDEGVSTFDPSAIGSDVTLADGNLTVSKSNSAWTNANAYSDVLVTSGNVYAEFTINSSSAGNTIQLGIGTDNTILGTALYLQSTAWSYHGGGGAYNNGTEISGYGETWGTGDIIGVRYNHSNGELEFYKNGVSQGIAYTLTAETDVYFAGAVFYLNEGFTTNFGATAFTYQPSGTTGLLTTPATNTSVTVSGQSPTDGDTLLINDGASTTLQEFDTTGKVTLVSDIDSPTFGNVGSEVTKSNNDYTISSTNNGTWANETGYTTEQAQSGDVFKFTVEIDTIGTNAPLVGLSLSNTNYGSYLSATGEIRYSGYNGQIYISNSSVDTVATFNVGDRVSFEYTYATGGVVIYLNDTSVYSGTITPSTAYYGAVALGSGTSGVNTVTSVVEHISTIDLTSASLTNAPTTIAKALPVIETSIVATGGADSFTTRTPQSITADKDGSIIANDEFDTVLYTGNGSTQTISLSNIDSGVDFIWSKNRDSAYGHHISNTVSGIGNELYSNSTSAEVVANLYSNLTNNSFDVSGDNNSNAQNYVAWCASLPNDNLGSELITNGTFDTDLSGWTTSGTTSVESGRGKIETDSGYINQQITTEIGKRYIATADIENGTASLVFKVGTTLDGFEYERIIYSTDNQVEKAQIIFTATTTTTYVGVSVGGSGDFVGYIDNASVKELDTTGTIPSYAKSSSFMSVGIFGGTGAIGTVGAGITFSGEDLIIFKNRDAIERWAVYHSAVGNTKALSLNETGTGYTDVGYFNNTSPSGTTFTVGANTNVNANSNSISFIAFTSVEGKCKVGSYTGTGASGNVVDCGFEPAWVMIKCTTGAQDWEIYDTTRGDSKILYPNLSSSESTDSNRVSLTTVGFTLDGTTQGVNGNGDSYIYLAITKDISQIPTEITTVFDSDTRSGRDVKHRVSMDNGDEVTRISTPVDKLV
jgi:hypothetical protein